VKSDPDAFFRLYRDARTGLEAINSENQLTAAEIAEISARFALDVLSE
jgi:hypothetical protein